MNILEEIIKRGLLDETRVSEVLRLAREKYEGSVDEALTSFGVTEDSILKIKSEFFGMPIKNVDPKTVTFEILKYIPPDSAKHYHFVPIGLVEGVLEVGVTDPDNIEAMDALQFISAKSNIPFKVYLISPSAFKAILDSYKGMTGEVDSALSDLKVI